MRCWPTVAQGIISYLKPGRDQASLGAAKDIQSDGDVCAVSDPIGDLFTQASDTLERAHQEAASLRFDDCLKTVNEAIPVVPPSYKVPCHALRAYALFRLGHDTEAGVAAAVAAVKGARNGFIRAMVSGDPALIAELRRVYPVVSQIPPAQASATMSHEAKNIS
jgi:hypothetical protein